VVDSVPGLIAHIDTDRRYTLVNRAYLAWDHRSQSEIVGRTVADVHGEAGYALLAPPLDRALAGELVAFEVALQRGDELRAMQVTYVPDLDEAGQTVGVFSMKVDVTPLRRLEERLRLVMEASPQGMFTTDLQGHCTYTNTAWQGIAGRTLAQSLGLGLGEVVHPDDLQQVQAAREAAVREGGVHGCDHRYRRLDGSLVWVRGQVTLLRRNGQPDSFIGTVEDVTAKRLLDQNLAAKTAELARSNDELERFAYVASHDLQEPLRMVTSYGQLLARRHLAELSSEAQEFLAFMVDGGQRAQALIRDLLSLARLDSPARPWQPVSLNAVLTDCLRQLAPLLHRADAVVTQDTLPTVLADAGQMAQLLGNLLSNALKFHSAAPPAIHVAAAREDSGWRISVRDNGIGIEPRYFERIFAMFQRLHLRADHEGTGIGLAICKKVVERHGGRITVKSLPGQGAIFSFTLPDHTPEAP
jgi:PAS domain S-box-containing protein